MSHIEAHTALAYASQHQRTHMDWIAYLKAGGELPSEEVGDIAHHEQCVQELNVICKVLRAATKDTGGDA